MTSKDPVFVTAIYGADYLPFLAPHLHSIDRCHPDAQQLVMWQDIPLHEIDLLGRAFPSCEFSRIEEALPTDPRHRISLKLNAWRTACGLFPDELLCFLDCDTLVVRPVSDFLGPVADILYTWKSAPWPINTGVLMIRSGQVGEPFFQEWLRCVERILADPAALTRAQIMSGAADQHALREMIGFVNYARPFILSIAEQPFALKGINCKVLNQTCCAPIFGDTYIIHYKAGWHPILLRGEGFTEKRPEARCREMYDFWLNIAADINHQVARRFVMQTASWGTHRLKEMTDGFEERGILHSEMLAVCAVCDNFDLDVIIESGRARGQSTLTLARYFAGRDVDVISIELVRDGDARFAEERLAPYENVRLLYGDSLRILPRLVKKLKGKRIAILLDGPKGQVAVDLLKKLLRLSDGIVVAFLHDVRKSSLGRIALQTSFARTFFTDDKEYVKAHKNLDEWCKPVPGDLITPHTWRPYRKGHEHSESYGPTLGVVFPLPSEGKVHTPKGISAKEFIQRALRKTLRKVLRCKFF